MKIALAQINPTVGALDRNSRKIEEIIQEHSPKCDLIVFPEMCLTGYPPQDLLMDAAFIAKTAEALEDIADKVQGTPVILGTIRQVEDKLFNTAAVLQNGKVIVYRDKTHLPTYDVFDEDRYFSAATTRMPVEINIHGNGSDRLDFTYIEDFISGVIKIIESQNAVNETFNLTYGESRTIGELAKIVEDQFPDIKINYLPKEKLTPDRGTLNVDKARDLIGYEPKFSIEEGFPRYINWYKTFWDSMNA